MIVNRIKQLMSDSVIYGLGGVLSRSISFLMLPIYTRVFTTEEYGNIEMLVVVSSLLAALMTVGQDSAQSFYFFKKKDGGVEEQGRVVSSGVAIRVASGLPIVIAASLAAPLVNNLLFSGSLGLQVFFIAFVGAFFNQLFLQVNEIFRLSYQPWPYIALSTLQAAIAASIVLFTVLILQQREVAFFVGTFVASIAMSITGWIFNRRYLVSIRGSRDTVTELLRYGVPLVPVELTMYAMSSADRWFLSSYKGVEAVAIYAVGAKIALILTFFFETFRKAWWPIALDAMHSSDGPALFRKVATLYIYLGMCVTLMFCFSAKWVTSVLSAPIYLDAWKIACVLSLQSFLYGFFLIVSAGIIYREKTARIAQLTGFAAVVGVILNALFVPIYGTLGAAVATVLSYYALITVTYLLSERYWAIGLPLPLFHLAFVFLSGTVGLLLWLDIGDAIKAFVVLFFGFAALFTIKIQLVDQS